MALWLCLIAIVISIFVGWKFKLNTGIIAIAFAFIIGVCVMGMKASQVIGYWPTTIVFYLLSIALFFNYATENGTMNVLGQKLLHAMGGNAKLIPFAIALVSAIVGGLGAGASTPAIVGPFAFVMAATAGVNPVLTAIAISFGNLVGSNNPYNGYGGTISKNLITTNFKADLAPSMGIDPSDAAAVSNIALDDAATGTIMNWSLKIWANCAIITVIIIVLFYLFYKGHKAQKVSLSDRAPEFNPVQKKTFAILLIAFVLMVVPPILNTWIKGVKFLSVLNQICQPQVIMMLGALACAILRLGDEKTVIRKIPISTIVMIVGVYSLIQVAAAAGLVDAISNVLASSIPRFLVPAAIVLFAAFLSFFSSSTSTVMPLMYPMVPALAAALSLNPVMLYTCIFFGGLATSCSPFSTGGAVCIAANPYEDQKEMLSNKMIICALIIPVITIIAALVGLFNIFPA